MTGPADAAQRWQQRVRPLRAGYSFGLAARTGTLGMVVRDVRDSRLLLLSSSHVLNRRADGRPYRVYQPAGRDRAEDDTPVAIAARYTVLDTRRANWSEGALAQPGEGIGIDPTHPLTQAAPRAARAVRVGEVLRKVGCSTGDTRARVESLDWSGPIAFRGRSYPFARQMLLRGLEGARVSLLGDSGAVWLNEHGEAVALNFAGAEDGRVSISTPIGVVFERLGVEALA